MYKRFGLLAQTASTGIMRATDVSVKVLGVPVRYSPVCCEQLQNTAFPTVMSCTILATIRKRNTIRSKSEPKLCGELIAGFDVPVPARAAQPGSGNHVRFDIPKYR
jgi:hypothetical protein